MDVTKPQSQQSNSVKPQEKISYEKSRTRTMGFPVNCQVTVTPGSTLSTRARPHRQAQVLLLWSCLESRSERSRETLGPAAVD